MSSRTSRAVKRHNSSKTKHHESHLPQPNAEGADGEVMAVAKPSMLSQMARKYKLQIMVAAPILLILMVLSTTTYLNYSNTATTPVAYGQFFAALDSSNANANDFNLNKAYDNAKNVVDPQTADFLTYIMGLIKYENTNTTADGIELLNSIASEPYKSLAQGFLADAEGAAYTGTGAKGSTAEMLPSLWQYRTLIDIAGGGDGDGNSDETRQAQMDFVDAHTNSSLASLINVIAAGQY